MFNLFVVFCSVCFCVSLKPKREKAYHHSTYTISSHHSETIQLLFSGPGGAGYLLQLKPKMQKHGSFIKVQ